MKAYLINWKVLESTALQAGTILGGRTIAKELYLDPGSCSGNTGKVPQFLKSLPFVEPHSNVIRVVSARDWKTVIRKGMGIYMA